MEGKIRVRHMIKWVDGEISRIYIFIWPYRIAFVPRKGRLVKDKKDFARYDKDRGYGLEDNWVPPDKFKAALRVAYEVYEKEQKSRLKSRRMMAGARAAELRHRRVLGDDY